MKLLTAAVAILLGLSLSTASAADKTLEDAKLMEGKSVRLLLTGRLADYRWTEVGSLSRPLGFTALWTTAVVESVELSDPSKARIGEANALGRTLSAGDILNPFLRIRVKLDSDARTYQAYATANTIDEIIKTDEDLQQEKVQVEGIIDELNDRSYRSTSIPEIYTEDSTAEQIFKGTGRRIIDENLYRATAKLSQGVYQQKYGMVLFLVKISATTGIIKGSIVGKSTKADVLKALELSADSKQESYTSGKTHASRTCFIGPRGGTYTITSSGKKNYGGC